MTATLPTQSGTVYRSATKDLARIEAAANPPAEVVASVALVSPRVGRWLIRPTDGGQAHVGPVVQLSVARSPWVACDAVACTTCSKLHEAYRWNGAEFWTVDGSTFDAHGFEVCFCCMEALGSPWCHDRSPELVVAYYAQARYLSDVGVRDLTPAEIVHLSPVNAGAR